MQHARFSRATLVSGGRRLALPLLGAMALAACDPAIPDSGVGIGFSDYQTYMREREAQLRGQRAGVVPSPQVNTMQSAPRGGGAPLSAIPSLGSAAVQGGDPTPQTIAQEALAAVGRERPAGAATGAFDGPVASVTPGGSGGGISDQTFSPTAPRQQEMPQAQQEAAYEMVQPTAIPERPGGGPNIVAYALQTTNRVGQQIHSRSRLTLQNHERNCAQFASQDLAQEEFLRRGGPERDPLNLDPNGDGFACWWDPEPFRAAARAGQSN